MLEDAGLTVKRSFKIYEGRPNVYDEITNGAVSVVVNSPSGADSAHDDSYLRKAAIKAKIPYMTTMAAAKATAEGILYVKQHGNSPVLSLQELHALIKDKA